MKNAQTTAQRLSALLATIDITEEREELATIAIAEIEDRNAVERGHERINQLRAMIREIEESKADNRDAAEALRRGGDVMAADRSKQDLLEQVAALQRAMHGISLDELPRRSRKNELQSKVNAAMYSAVRPLLDEIGEAAVAAIDAFLENRALANAITNFCGHSHGAPHHRGLEEIGRAAFKMELQHLVAPRVIDPDIVRVMEDSGLATLGRGWVKREVELPF